MGKLEERTRKRRRRENFQRAVLGVVAGAGIVAVGALALPLLMAAGQVAKQGGYRIRYRAKTATGRLVQKGWVRFVKRDGRTYVEITETGRRAFALQHARASAIMGHKRRWDRRYRIVMFDIPQKRRTVRDRLRLLMKDVGFLRIQDSVWLSPYDCEELIALVKAELRLGKDVLYTIVEEIEDDGWIKKHFNLP